MTRAVIDKNNQFTEETINSQAGTIIFLNTKKETFIFLNNMTCISKYFIDWIYWTGYILNRYKGIIYTSKK